MLESKLICAGGDLLLNISLAGGQSLKWINQKREAANQLVVHVQQSGFFVFWHKCIFYNFRQTVRKRSCLTSLDAKDMRDLFSHLVLCFL